MRRRISILLATVLAAAGFTVLIPGRPATAWTVCAGTGYADITGGGLLYPVSANTPGKSSAIADILIGNKNVNPIYGFSFYFEAPLLTVPAGTCVHPQTSPPGVTTNKTPTVATPASGTVAGYCGLSSGRGTFSTNASLFAFVGVGGVLIITGHLVGIVNAVPDTPSGQSCAHTGAPGTLPGAGALRFRVQGAVLLLNCDASLQTLVPGTPNDTEVSQGKLTDILEDGIIHVKNHLNLRIYYNHQCVGNPVL